MLQVTQPSDVTRSNVGVEKEFTIKRTAQAFQILSSGLYSNKILAIVRELSCNAWDSHVAAGKTDLPIEIKLPTHVDDTFYIKDLGIGLSHIQVVDIFTTYFESTKTDSNDFIGALGLGSKSPFSYTSNFVVESRYDRVKRVYTMFINEHGIPAVAPMGEEPTDEPNGVTVMFPVKSNDRQAFAEAASEALVYFNPAPVIKGAAGFKVDPIKFSVQGDGWNIRDSKNRHYVNEGPRVVQGFVSYPINMNQVVDGATSEEHRQLVNALRRIDIDVIVPIGEVEVAASRESLSYDKRTTQNLAKRLAALAPMVTEELQHNLDMCPTIWDATKLYSQYTTSGSTFRDLIFTAKGFTYRGGPISESVTLELTEAHANVFVERRFKLTNRRTSTVDEAYKFVSDMITQTSIIDTSPISDRAVAFSVVPAGVTFILDDIGHSVQRNVDGYLNSRGVSRVVVFRNVNLSKKQPVDVASVETVLAQVGLTLASPDVSLMSDITSKKLRAKSTYVKKAPDVFKVWTGFTNKKRTSSWYHRTDLNRTFSRLTWKDSVVDMNDPAQVGYYVPIDRFSVVKAYDREEFTGIDILLSYAMDVGIIEQLPLIGVPVNDVSKVNPKHWKNLFELVDASIKHHMDAGLGEELARSQVQSDIDPGGVLGNAWQFMSASVTPGDVKTFLDTAFTPHVQPVEKWKKLLTQVGVPVDATISAVVNAKRDEWQQLIAKYDIWQCINWDRCSRDRTCAAVAAKYLNLCMSLT